MKDNNDENDIQQQMQIDAKAAQTLRSFKYKGSNISYSYNWIWSPFAEWLVQFVPQTWAPNSITVAGALLNIGSALLLWLAPSSNLILLYSVCIFSYYTLDNIDGKQARRLNNSTPLGMLMDHGCDIFGAVYISLAVNVIVGLGENFFNLWIIFLGVLCTFQFSVWSQYYSNGVMILGKINCIDDGLPFVSFIAFITYCFGNDIWSTTFTVGGYQILAREIFRFFILLAGIGQMVTMYMDTRPNLKNKKEHLDLAHLLMGLAVLVCLTVQKELWAPHYYQILFTFGVVYSRNVTYMMTCTTALIPYKQFYFSNVFFAAAYILSSLFLHRFLSTNFIVWAIFLVVFIDYVYFISVTFYRIAEALDIYIFKVNKVKN